MTPKALLISMTVLVSASVGIFFGDYLLFYIGGMVLGTFPWIIFVMCRRFRNLPPKLSQMEKFLGTFAEELQDSKEAPGILSLPFELMDQVNPGNLLEFDCFGRITFDEILPAGMITFVNPKTQWHLHYNEQGVVWSR